AQKFWGEQPNRFEDHEMLVDALAAVANKKMMQIGYEDTQTGERELKTLVTLGVGTRFGRWYLAGAYELGQQPRLFRFDRIESLVVLNQATRSELNFSMSDQLKRLSSVAPLGLWVQQPKHPHPEVIPSYSLTETVTQALMGGYKILPEPSRDSSQSGFTVERSYQHRAAEEFLRVRNVLCRTHSGAAGFQREEHEFEPVSQTRRRASAEEQTTQLLSISQVIMENPGIALQDLAHRFGMTPAKLRKQLESLWATLDPLRFEIHIENDAVSISSSFDFGSAIALNGVETALLFLSIEFNRHLQASQNRFDEAQAILLTAHPQYKHVASALAIVEEFEIELLRRAISQSRIVKFDYVREQQRSHRSVVPQELLFQEGNYYMAGFCLDRQAPRVFRVDRMQELALLYSEMDDLPVYENPLRWNVEPTEHTEFGYVQVESDVVSPALWMLRQHATAVAHLGAAHILQIPLRNPAWLIEATISARGTAQILYPQRVREQLLAQVEGI
ncbi:MAG: WYL domain-containing protein, partial [Rothia sp. (in: high G+C Gram-positive bacteria)]|nr:WYL domain-containing protein [Rothia sp. (in: high G+C Gram-positive bacteria)]